MNTFRILKIRDPRTPGFCWWEIEGQNEATGERWTAAVCDTLAEARETIKAIRSAERTVA
jgi:hypothetical protein